MRIAFTGVGGVGSVGAHSDAAAVDQYANRTRGVALILVYYYYYLDLFISLLSAFMTEDSLWDSWDARGLCGDVLVPGQLVRILFDGFVGILFRDYLARFVGILFSGFFSTRSCN